MREEMVDLRADRDAFGHMLMDYLETGHSVEIIERSDGNMDGGTGYLNYFAEFEQWPAHQQKAMGLLRSGRTLDMGCGAGRVELYLQGQGVEVVGIDNSPLAIEVCKRRGVKDARLLSITQVSAALGTFANIVMMGNNWGLMGNHERARWLLRRFYKITTPEARILAESLDVYQTEDPRHLAYQAWNRAHGRMSGQIRLRVRYHLHCNQWFDYLMVSQEEMREIAAGTGWRVTEILPAEGAAYMGILEKE